MSLQITDRPGREIRECPIDPGFDFCAALSQGDWIESPFIIIGECTLAGVFLIPDTINGLISTVNTFPNMTLFSALGESLNTLVYNPVLGYYVPQLEICIEDTDYVLVRGVEVTLKTGQTCTNAEFFQIPWRFWLLYPQIPL